MNENSTHRKFNSWPLKIGQGSQKEKGLSAIVFQPSFCHQFSGLKGVMKGGFSISTSATHEDNKHSWLENGPWIKMSCPILLKTPQISCQQQRNPMVLLAAYLLSHKFPSVGFSGTPRTFWAPYFSYTYQKNPWRYGNGMGIVWGPAYHTGVPCPWESRVNHHWFRKPVYQPHLFSTFILILLMDKILHHQGWWLKPIVYKVLIIPGGAWFCPSTVFQGFFLRFAFTSPLKLPWFIHPPFTFSPRLPGRWKQTSQATCIVPRSLEGYGYSIGVPFV